MKFFHLAACAVLVTSGFPGRYCVSGQTKLPSKPNIVVIYADDLGYGDVQCYNSDRGKIPTPHIDALAAEGMRFTDGHSSSGVCSPSRYTILTGRYHWRSRLQAGIVGLWAAPLIAPDRMTIGSLAGEQGYHTACIGKWHLGWDWPIAEEKKELFRTGGYGGKKDIEATDEHRAAWRETFSQPIAGGPATRGFGEYFGTDVPNWPPYCFIENDRTVGIPSEFAAAELFVKDQASVQGPALDGWTLEPILPALGDRVAAYIEREAKTPEPFLIYMPLTSPHTPLSVNEQWKGKSGLNLYADFVMETDAIVGQVMVALDRSGAADNTLVVFTSDNGCAPYIGVEELEKKGHYPSGPLRGYKSDVWEGGHRVPFIVRWPGVIDPGSECGQLVHQADLLATFAEILGKKLPEDAGEDSFSLVPLLRGNDKPVRDHAVSCSSRGLPSLRDGDWKLILGAGSGGWAKGGDDQPLQLYNLADDVGEKTNLAAEQPDRVKRMQAMMEKLITDGRSSPGAPQKNDVKVKRYPKNPTVARGPHPDAIPSSHAPGEVDVPELVPLIVKEPTTLPGIVIDETEAVLVGKWKYSTHTPPYVGLGYLHDQNSGKGNSSVTYTPDLPEAGVYEVRMSHCYNVRRSTNTPVTIHHADGQKTIRINQQDIPPHARLFRSLGTYRFKAGKQGWLRIATEGTDGKYVIADAVQFISVDTKGRP